VLTIYTFDPLPHQHKEVRGINGSEELLWHYHSPSLESYNVLANASGMTATTAEGKNDGPLGLFCYHLWA